jgi:hypothetical protein
VINRLEQHAVVQRIRAMKNPEPIVAMSSWCARLTSGDAWNSNARDGIGGLVADHRHHSQTGTLNRESSCAFLNPDTRIDISPQST